MFNNLPKIIVAVSIAFIAQGASAQHANFVLLGEPNAAAAEVSASEKFVHPVTSPYFHEDSFVTTDIRAVYAYHNFGNNTLGGGDATVYAVQARVALTDSLQFVAYKDGYTDLDTGAVRDAGWNDVAAGLKWNFIQDWDNQFHMAVGAGYEIKWGDGEALQNDDEWRAWASVNKGFDELHLGATLNYFWAGRDEDTSNGFGNSDRISWHLHADYYVNEWFSPLAEINGYHVTNEGQNALGYSGLDLLNLGGDKDEDVVSYAFGAEFRPMDNVAARAAYESELTNNEGIFGNRWTLSLILSF